MMKQTDLAKMEEKIVLWRDALTETGQWWKKTMQEKISEYELIKKEMEKVGHVSEEIEERSAQLENEIKSLVLKSEWELKEIFKFEKLEEKFNKDIEVEILHKLSKNIKNKLKK